MVTGRRVLVIAPHMDDEVLGLGGTIGKHVGRGDHVAVVFVAHRIYRGKFDEEANKREMEHALAAKEKLGYHGVEFLNLNDERLDVAVQDIIKPIEAVLDRVNPEIVYSNFYGDNNQDHRAVFQAMRVVLRPCAMRQQVEWYLYETPSSTDQSPPILDAVFLPNYHVDVSETFALKIDAFHCYESEKRSFPHPRSERALAVLAERRGMEMGLEKAEAFMIMRRVWS